MRKMTYLSPTSLSLFLKDQKEFYLTYLADHRPERPPQTEPMAVGSAFDAFVKSYLYHAIFGSKDARFEKMAIFEAQVSPQCRDKAYKAGEHCFEQYKKAGCLVDLMLELQNAVTEPKFEFDIMGQVDGYREGMTRDLGPVPFLGKPDVFFTNKKSARVIFDWKVNGYYSKYTISPMKGYVRFRDAMGSFGQHKEAHVQMWNGMKINIAHYMEMLNEDWARQLSIYAWLCGEEVGTEQCIAGIDQLVCTPDSVRPVPKIRIAEHRLRISKEYQFKVFGQAQEAWEIINSDHYFRNMDKAASQERCKFLDNLEVELAKQPVQNNDDWFARMEKRS